MGMYIFKTLVREDHKHGNNEYVLGRIGGIQQVMCNGEPLKGFAVKHVVGTGAVLMTECTPEQYVAFMKFVKEMYPGLCVFAYKEPGLYPRRGL